MRKIIYVLFLILLSSVVLASTIQCPNGQLVKCYSNIDYCLRKYCPIIELPKEMELTIKYANIYGTYINSTNNNLMINIYLTITSSYLNSKNGNYTIIYKVYDKYNRLTDTGNFGNYYIKIGQEQKINQTLLLTPNYIFDYTDNKRIEFQLFYDNKYSKINSLEIINKYFNEGVEIKSPIIPYTDCNYTMLAFNSSIIENWYENCPTNAPIYYSPMCGLNVTPYIAYWSIYKSHITSCDDLFITKYNKLMFNIDSLYHNGDILRNISMYNLKLESLSNDMFEGRIVRKSDIIFCEKHDNGYMTIIFFKKKYPEDMGNMSFQYVCNKDNSNIECINYNPVIINTTIEVNQTIINETVEINNTIETNKTLSDYDIWWTMLIPEIKQYIFEQYISGFY